MKSYNELLDLTVPHRAELVNGKTRYTPLTAEEFLNPNQDLKLAIDGITDGLSTGTAEARRAKFFTRVQTIAKSYDLSFADVWGMVMAHHPELQENETLLPRGFAPKLKTLSQRKAEELETEQRVAELEKKKVTGSEDLIEGFARQANENRLIRIKKLQASDPSLTFQSAWDQTDPAKFVELSPPVAHPQSVQAEDLDLPPGVFLVHGAQAGMVCPLLGWDQ